jgi:hypothetical protein
MHIGYINQSDSLSFVTSIFKTILRYWTEAALFKTEVNDFSFVKAKWITMW